MRSYVAVLTTIVIMGVASSGHTQIQTEKHFIDGNFDEGFWMVDVDFDSDGDPDLVVASRLTGIEWFENNGTGSFTSHTVSTTFLYSWSVGAADFDNDGDFDVVAVSAEEESGSMPEISETAWFEQNSDGSFTEHLLDEDSGLPHSVFPADVDGDGNTDILVASWGGNRIVWWENDGDGNFTENILDSNFNSPHSISAADLDNDDDLDIIAAGAAQTAWWRNNGGSFTRLSLGQTGGFGAFPRDLNGDGRIDIIRTERADFDLDWFENLDGTNFAQRTIQGVFGESWSVDIGDFDRDGDNDVVAASYVPKDPDFLEDHISAFFTDDYSTYDELVLEQFNVGDRPRIVAVTDIDGDGDQDIAALITRTDDLVWYEVLGSPQASLSVTAPNGGEILETGQLFTIEWQSAGDVTDVKLEYSTDSGATWSEILASTPNDGSHDWTVPNDTSTTALVRVSDAADGDPIDTSDDVFSIVESTITVTSPNGGESWVVGSTQTITWNSTGLVDSVRIEYSLDNGASWTTIVAQTPADGSHDWAVPDTSSQETLIRITDADDGSPTDISDDVFSLLGTALTITSPNGGETWLAGSSQTITWATTGTVEFVTLEYSADNGSTWNNIITNISNTGNYPWTVPAINSNNALVRVFDASDGEPIDVSDAVFNISMSSLTLTAPNGGETWTAGSVETIAWNTTGTIDSVALEYSVDGGTTWKDIVSAIENTGSYDWTVPEDPTEDARVRVSDAEDGTPADASAGVFTIIGSTLNVTAPNGGETWPGGSTQNITWSSTGPIDSVKIEVSLNNGADWTLIAAAAPNSGVYSWNVTNQASDSALVRISDSSDGAPIDVSDAVFSITSSALTITAPNGGELFLAGSTQTITWTTEGDITSVTIDYSLNSGQSWTNIITSTLNSGSYDWTLPDVQTSKALVRVQDAADGNPSDVSDNTFSIVRSTLTVTSPNGGETWTAGTPEPVTWHSTGFIDSVTIEYSLDSGGAWLTVATRTINDGIHLWTVPDTSSTTTLIRITDVENSQISDTSDAVFAIENNGTSVAIDRDSEVIPEKHTLFQNFPNPFNPVTTIRFALPERSHVDLRVYNMLGELVEVLVADEFAAGEYSVQWNAAHLPSGPYLYRLQTDRFVETRKLTLLK